MIKKDFQRACAFGIVLIFVIGAFGPAVSSVQRASTDQKEQVLVNTDLSVSVLQEQLDRSVSEDETRLLDDPPIGPPAPLDTPHTFYDEVGEIYKKPTSYMELVSWYQHLEENYSGYIQVFKANELYNTGTIPKTGGGSYDLYYVRVTNESLGFHKPEVFFSGGTHGNERIGVIGLYWTLDWLMRSAFHPQYDCPEREYLQWLLDNREIYIEISHNPDGFDQNVRGDYLGRDLNREADHDASYGPFASVNGKTLMGFMNNHTLRTAVWYHCGARLLLYPWQDEHSTITGISPISSRSYGHVPADFYFFDTAGLLLGDYIGDYGGNLDKNAIGSSYSMGMGGPGCLTSWAYGGDNKTNTVENTYVELGPHSGAGVFAWDPEAYTTGDPAQSTYGNDTINRFGAEVRRMFMYLTDLAQPSVHWIKETPDEYVEIEIGAKINLSWLVNGCLVVDHTQLQYGTDPDPIHNALFTTTDNDTHADDYYGGSYWDNASNGNVTTTEYTEELSFDEPGDYYVVAKAMVDQKYADVLRSDYYGSTSYLRMINERTDGSFSESLSGTDGLEEINGQLWWYSPVLHIRAKGFAWYNTSYPYRKELTIDHTKVDDYLTDFPVLIDITDTDLASKAQSNGNDIIFTDMSNIKLNHEIEYYNSGHLITWVNVTSLASTLDTILYMYYGNQTIGNQENPAGVWDENYMMVQHLSEISGIHYDSTINDNDGTPNGGVVQGTTGKVDGADDFDGTDDYLQVPHDDTLSGFTQGMTASAWVKFDTTAARKAIVGKFATTGNQRSWNFEYVISPSRALQLTASHNGTLANNFWNANVGTLSTAAWYHVAVGWQSSERPTFYLNGTKISISQISGINLTQLYNNVNTPLFVGRTYSTPPERCWDGKIDEVCVSNINRSAAWIKTSYNNQVDPSSFISVGAEKGPIVILNPSPTDGENDVPTTITSLSFNITHVQGKTMSYTVQTSPNIGSTDVTGATNGTKYVSISGLQECAIYTWYVNVTDGANLIHAVYTFNTECNWWDDWTYRKQITVPYSKVNGPLTNFPVLIDITDSDLAAHAQGDGDDIVFTTDETRKLNHEIEYYASGHLVAWVNVTSLSSTQDTVLFMYYGKADAVNQENPVGVWDANYMMVQHLSETSGAHYDSTINNNDGTPNGGVIQGTSGKIDGADEFDGVDDSVNVPHANTLAGFTQGMTASAWIKLDSNNNFNSILTKYNSSGTNLRGWQLYYDGTDTPVPRIRFVISQTGGAAYASYYVNFTPIINTWYYIAAVWTSGQRPTIYVNDVAYIPDTITTYTSIHNNDPEPLYIGKSYTSGRVLNGIIDEACVSNASRNQSWMVTSYTNQANPSSFYTVGYEEIFGNNPPRLFGETPVNNTIDVSVNQAIVNVTIQDPEGDGFDWTIEGKYVNDAAGNDAFNGSKSAALIKPLPYETQIVWYVNCTDSGSGLWKKAIYSFTTEEEPIHWWNVNWDYRRQIVIDHTKVSGSLSNFPILIDITNESIGSYAQIDGDDFVFTTLSGTVLHHEIERYTSSTGHLIAWVNVTDLSSIEDTILFLYYGNPTAGNQQNPAGVWDSHFMMVQHLEESPANGVQGHLDSTSNNNHGTPYNFSGTSYSTTNVTGKIDGADWFDGTNDNILVPHQNTLAGFTVGMTASAWVKFNTSSTTLRKVIVGKYAIATPQRSWNFEYMNSPASLQFTGSKDGAANPAASIWNAAFTPTAGTWYYVTVGWEANKRPTFTVNGNKRNITTSSGPGNITQLYNNLNTPLFIGRTYTTDRFWAGLIDEVCVSNINRSAAWINTSYLNQANPSGFSSLGAEENAPPLENQPPVVTDIPDQMIAEGLTFATITLDNFVSDADNTDAEMTWTATGQSALTVTISDRIATIIIPNVNWYGTETVTFRATDPGALYDEDSAVFTVTAVNDPPVVTDIPDQTIAEGSMFATINLDDYVTDVDNTDAQMTWTYSGNSELTVSIVARVATITLPSLEWNGAETITFKATDPASLWDDDVATFTVTGVNDPPVVSGIPDQTITEGSSFATIALDDYVNDPDNLDSEIIWTYSGNTDLIVTIIDRIATIGIPSSEWNGVETITFKATDPAGLWDDDAATFTVTAVNDPPVVADIPDQTIAEGSTFTTINLDDFVTDVDNDDAQMTWTYSGNSELTVSIVARVATITLPSLDWNGAETITFRATDPGALYSEDSATFTVTAENDPPVFTSETPTNNSIDRDIDQPTVSVTIEDPEGDTFDWTIEGKYVNDAAGNDASNGSKSATLITPLPYETQIVWYVNCTDSESGSTNAIYRFTTEKEPISIISDFDSGSIESYTINQNTINFTLTTDHLINSGEDYTYWTDFTVHNTLNKNITFHITNANLVGFLSNTAHEVQMVYSYDGINWNRLTNHTYSTGTYTFWKNFTQNEVQIATFFPFSYTEMQNYLETVNESQWATKTVLGISTQSRNITLLTITNSSISNATKKVIYIIGRQHASETSSSHMLKGLIDFLISDNSNAKRMRDSFVWYIVPMVNPDGVYLGNTRGTSLLRDPNDDWSNTNSVEINIVKNHLTTTNSALGVDFFIDWHSQLNDTSWYNYIYSPPGNTFFSILSKWTDFDTQTSPGVGSSSARGYATGLGIFTFTFEPTPHLSTWTLTNLHQQGEKTAYAIDEYFTKYTLTISTVGNGTVTKDPDQLTYFYGDVVQLTATANATWSFDHWSGALGGSTNPVNLTITENMTVTAHFTNGPYTLTLTTSGTGLGTIQASPAGPYYYGASVTIWANASIGSIFTGFTGDLTGTVTPQVLVMNGNKAVNAQFTSTILLTDSTFDASIDSADLRTNSVGQDWYESRLDNQTLLTLNTSAVGGNTGKKAAMKGHNQSTFAYLSQEFSLPQTTTFTVSFDMFIDKVSDYPGAPYAYDRTGTVFIGDDHGGTNGPCSTGNERFLVLAFYDPTPPSDTGNDLELRILQGGQSFIDTSLWTQLANGLSYDTWYTITFDINFNTGTYDVYLNGVLKGDNIQKYSSFNGPSLTHISYYVGGFSRGDFYVDNVFSLAVERYRLTTNVVGNGSITVSPGESTYAAGTEVTLTAVAGLGWTFSHWTGNLTGSTNPTSITMNGNRTVTANFTLNGPYTLTLTQSGTGSGTIQASPSGPYSYGTSVTIWANTSVGSTFTGFNGSLTGTTTPQTLVMNGNKAVDAQFTLNGPYTLSFTTSGTGTGTIQASPGPYYYGSTAIIWANASTGSTFTGFTGSLTGTTTPQILTIDGNEAVDAAFILNGPYTLTLTTSGTGTGTIQASPGPYYNGASVTIWANASTGVTFAGFTGGLTGTVTPQVLVMDGNNAVDAQFTVIQYHSIDVKTYWNLISIPVYDTISKADIIVRYDSHDHTWAEAVNELIVLDTLYDWQRGSTQAYAPTDTLVPGNGYWMWAYHDCELHIACDVVGTGQITDLQTKWNIMGFPYEDSLIQTLLKIEYPLGTTLTWNEAVAGNIILGFIYGWDSTTQMYVLETMLEPGQGYWMYAYYDCILKKESP